MSTESTLTEAEANALAGEIEELTAADIFAEIANRMLTIRTMELCGDADADIDQAVDTLDTMMRKSWHAIFTEIGIENIRATLEWLG